MDLHTRAMEEAIQLTKEAEQQAEEQRNHEAEAFDARVRRDTEEGPQWIYDTFGIQAEFSGVQQRDEFNHGGVWFKLLDDLGGPVADRFVGRLVRSDAHREQLSRGLYVTESRFTSDDSTPFLEMSQYAPDEQAFRGTADVRNVVELWNALHTTLHLNRLGDSYDRHTADRISIPIST